MAIKDQCAKCKMMSSDICDNLGQAPIYDSNSCPDYHAKISLEKEERITEGVTGSAPVQAPIAGTAPSHQGLTFKKETIDAISDIAKWTKFISVFYYVVLGILFLCGIIVFIDGFAESETEDIESGFVTLIVAAIMYLPTKYLLNSSKAFRRYVDSNHPSELETALAQTKSFWSYAGIMLIIYLVIIVLAIIISIANA